MPYSPRPSSVESKVRGYVHRLALLRVPSLSVRILTSVNTVTVETMHLPWKKVSLHFYPSFAHFWSIIKTLSATNLAVNF